MSRNTTTASLSMTFSPEEIWDVMTDLESYSDWKSGISEAEGTAKVGNSFRFRADIAPERMVAMKVAELDAPNRMVLTGGLPLGLFKAIRTYEIDATSKGSRVTVTESFSGLMKAFVRSPPTLLPSFELYCSGLQKEVKRRNR